MDVVVLHTVLKSGREPDYDRLHQEIPEAVASALREHGVHEWRIWRDGRDVFHLVEVEDYAAMRARLARPPRKPELAGDGRTFVRRTGRLLRCGSGGDPAVEPVAPARR